MCVSCFYLHRLHYRKLFICEKALFQRIHVWMNSKEWWRWCIFNLFVDSVLYVIDLQRISLRTSFVSYKISSVTFGSPLEKDIVSWSKRNKSTLLAFRLFILQAILSSCVCVWFLYLPWLSQGLGYFRKNYAPFSLYHANFQYSVRPLFLTRMFIFSIFSTRTFLFPYSLCPRLYVHEWIYFTALVANSGHLTIFVHSLEHILWINYK